MRRSARFIGFTLAAVVGLALLGLAVVAATFDADDLKALAIERMQREHQRTLAIPGPVSLRFLPRLAIELGEASLSERGGAEPFASVASARASLALWPLLRGQWVVDRLQVQGLRATLVRQADGRWNVDDWLATPEAAGPAPAPSEAAPPMRLDIAGVSVVDATLTFDDRQRGRRFVLSKAGLETGRLAPGTAGTVRFSGHAASAQPLLEAELELSARWLPEPARGRHTLSGMRGAVSGRLGPLAGAKLQFGGNAILSPHSRQIDLDGVELTLQAPLSPGLLDLQVQLPQLRWNDPGGAGGTELEAAKIVASATLLQGPRTLRARVRLPPFAASAPQFSLPGVETVLNLEGEPGAPAGSPPAEARLSATLQVDLQAGTAALAPLALAATLPLAPGGAAALQAQGRASAALQTERVEVQLAGQLDDSRFDGRYALQGHAAPVHDFQLDVDRIDLDRFRAARAPAASGADPGQEAPPGFEWLRTLHAAGRVQVGVLKASGLTVRQLRAELRARDGRLVADPLSADLYQGRASGSLSFSAGSPPGLATRQTWTGVALGPLLKDLLGRDTLSGRGTLVLDVAAQGSSFAALTRALQGSARIELRDGSVRGFNVAQALRGAAALLGRSAGAHDGTGSASEATDFSELAGSFRIRHGVAHNEDLRAKSPLLRVSGSGDIDLGAGRLDYLVKATVVETLQGQGGPELQSLRGLTLPVRLTGPFEAVTYRVDTAGLLQDLARRKLQDKLGEKLQDKAAGKTSPAQQQLLDKLKGLLGK